MKDKILDGFGAILYWFIEWMGIAFIVAYILFVWAIFILFDSIQFIKDLVPKDFIESHFQREYQWTGVSYDGQNFSETWFQVAANFGGQTGVCLGLQEGGGTAVTLEEASIQVKECLEDLLKSSNIALGKEAHVVILWKGKYCGCRFFCEK